MISAGSDRCPSGDSDWCRVGGSDWCSIEESDRFRPEWSGILRLLLVGQEVVHGTPRRECGVVGDAVGVGATRWRVEIDVDLEDTVLEGDSHVEVFDGRPVEPREDDAFGGLGGRLDDRLVRDHSVAGAGTARTGAAGAAAAHTAEHVLQFRLELLELLLDALFLLGECLDAEFEVLDFLF